MSAIGDDLYRWWMDLAHTEAEAAAAKAAEYGSNSMTELGHEINKIANRAPITDAEATELACYFYIKGKIGRWSDSILSGTRVSDDTIHDIGVYVRMVQRVRSNGGWPGGVTGQDATKDEVTSWESDRPVGSRNGLVPTKFDGSKIRVSQPELPGWEGSD